MFNVALSYRTKICDLMARMSTSQTVATRAEADELRATLLKEVPRLSGADITITNAKPLPTVDKAMQHFYRHLSEYPAEA